MATKSDISTTPRWFETPWGKAVLALLVAGGTFAGGYASSAAKDPIVAPVVAPQTVQPQTAPLPPVAPPAVLQQRIDDTQATVGRIEHKVDNMSDDITEIKIGLARLAPRGGVTNVGKNP